MRQFDFIGMTRADTEKYLGPADGTMRATGEPFYWLHGDCVSSDRIAIVFRNDRVAAYQVTGGLYGSPANNPAPNGWITTNVKPDFGVDLHRFCLENSSL